MSHFDLLPDGVIALILTALMAVDAWTLVMSAPNLCRSWRAVCRDQISLELNTGWSASLNRFIPFSANQEEAVLMPMIMDRFRWVYKLSLKGPTPWGQLANIHYLKSLSLSGVLEVTDEVVEELVAMCTGLEHLGLRHCYRLKWVGALVKCKNLTSLDLAYSNRISVASIVRLAAGCSDLEHLDLTCCLLTDVAASALASGCKGLKYLSCSGWVEFTDAGVVALASGCAGLQHLDISRCRKITDTTIAALSRPVVCKTPETRPQSQYHRIDHRTACLWVRRTRTPLPH
jgi:hypothetical protein